MGSLELWVERLVLAVSTQHRLADAQSVRWEEIRSEALLVPGWSGSHTIREIEAHLLGSLARFKTHHAGCIDLLNLVSINVGVMVAIESHRELTIPGVRYIEIDEPDASMGVALAWSLDLEDPVSGSFVAFMRDRMGRRNGVALEGRP